MKQNYTIKQLDALDKLAQAQITRRKEGRGFTGKQGVTGPRGGQGEIGLRGEVGSQGRKGDLGDKGTTGTRGERGERGERGDPGTSGQDGKDGSHAELDGIIDGILKGEKGARGVDGLQGDIGLTGETGETGNKGVDGKDGLIGAIGKIGAIGAIGEKGLTGVAGLDGLDGREGAIGLMGDPGRDGKDGKDGKIGLRGAKGDKGKDGEDGKVGPTNIISGGPAFMPRSAREQTTSPGVTDDQEKGYLVGSRWWDTTNDKEYVCLDKTTGFAVWKETTASGVGSGDVSGPITSTDEAIARWNGTDGETLQDTGLKISDTDVLNMGLNEFINIKIENVNPTPAAGTTGRLVYLTTDNRLYLDQG